jgi:predicted  nucleic acid-binding Zn-ribbon protein/mono/diheme cytochrome c family protein
MPPIRHHIFSTGKLAALLLALLPLATASGAEKITYDDDIFPIFEQSCLNCHNPDKEKGGLDLSHYGGAMKGSSGGKVIASGDGASSTLFNVVTHATEPEMPPKGDKLGKKETDLIRAWIDGGALETKSSKARKPTGPKINLALQTDSTSKPEGPPPMPGLMSMEPVVVGARSAVVADMATSPWAPLLAVTGQKQILLYHTGTLRLIGILPFPSGQPETLSFHPSGKYLLAGGGIAGKSGTTITWDITTGEELMRNGREFDSVLAASLRNDLSSVALGGPSRLIKIWDTQSTEQSHSIKKHTDWITGLSYSPDGILLATADRNGGAWVWEAGSGNEFHTLRAHQKAITALTWRADSNLLATASEDGQVIFWEMNNGKQAKKIEAHKSGVLAFDYARDGHFATSGRDRRVKLWQPDFKLKKELPPFSQAIGELAFSQDGKRLFAADWNGAITVWDTATFKKVGTLESNPPKLATRITKLESAIAQSPATLAKANTTLVAARKPLDDARKKLADTIAKRDQLKNQINALQKERQKLEEAWKATEEKRDALAEPRKEQQNSLKQARKALNTHRSSHQRSKEDRTKAKGVCKQLEAEEKVLAENEQAKIEELKAIRLRLESARKEVASANERIAQLDQQLPPLTAAVQEHQGKWKDISASWDRNEKERKRIAGTKPKVAERSKKHTQKLTPLEKTIPPLQVAVTTQEKSFAPAHSTFKKTKAHLARLPIELKRWQTATAVDEYLSRQKDWETLQAVQDEALDIFSAQCNALEIAKKEVAETPAPESPENVAKIAKISNEIARQKAAIDARATKLVETKKTIDTLKARSEQLSAQP